MYKKILSLAVVAVLATVAANCTPGAGQHWGVSPQAMGARFAAVDVTGDDPRLGVYKRRDGDDYVMLSISDMDGDHATVSYGTYLPPVPGGISTGNATFESPTEFKWFDTTSKKWRYGVFHRKWDIVLLGTSRDRSRMWRLRRVK